MITLDRALGWVAAGSRMGQGDQDCQSGRDPPSEQGWGQKPVLLLSPGQGVLWACSFSREDALMN